MYTTIGRRGNEDIYPSIGATFNFKSNSIFEKSTRQSTKFSCKNSTTNWPNFGRRTSLKKDIPNEDKVDQNSKRLMVSYGINREKEIGENWFFFIIEIFRIK